MTGSSSWLAAILYGSVLRRAFARAMSLWTARALRTFEADARRCVAINEETLTSILRRHRHTEFGRAHDFEAILATSAPLAEFRCATSSPNIRRSTFSSLPPAWRSSRTSAR